MVRCNDSEMLLSGSEMSLPNSKVEQLKHIKELEAQAGFVLPGDIELLDISDGGGRDQSYGYLSWVLYSPTTISTMPLDVTSYINGYMERLLDTTELIESRLGNRKIKQPQSAFSSRWEMNGYKFYGIVVRTLDGDYMLIQRFRIM